MHARKKEIKTFADLNAKTMIKRKYCVCEPQVLIKKVTGNRLESVKLIIARPNLKGFKLSLKSDSAIAEPLVNGKYATISTMNAN